jgi:hypothetical protein
VIYTRRPRRHSSTVKKHLFQLLYAWQEDERLRDTKHFSRWKKTREERSSDSTSKHGTASTTSSDLDAKRSIRKTAWSSGLTIVQPESTRTKREYEAFDLGVPHGPVCLLALPATSFHPKSSDDSILHENVETGTVEYESELPETDDLETLGK